MGSRIKRPVDFQGITRKEARTSSPTEGTFSMEGNYLNQKWKHWNESSEESRSERRKDWRRVLWQRKADSICEKHHLGPTRQK
eukprot:2661007-Heterocapsa_arctica.AAC.1